MIRIVIFVCLTFAVNAQGAGIRRRTSPSYYGYDNPRAQAPLYSESYGSVSYAPPSPYLAPAPSNYAPGAAYAPNQQYVPPPPPPPPPVLNYGASSPAYGAAPPAYGATTSYGKTESYAKDEPYYPPQPYAFAYNIDDGYGNSNYRSEESDGKRVKGTYGYLDANGVYRYVDYVADEYGFRPTIRTNEPGTDNQNPADTQITAQEPPASVYPSASYSAPYHAPSAYGPPPPPAAYAPAAPVYASRSPYASRSTRPYRRN